MSSFWESAKESLSPSAEIVPWAIRYVLHASLAALQMLFLVLFCFNAAGLWIHYLILCVLCGGLWVAVTWFLHELDTGKAIKSE